MANFWQNSTEHKRKIHWLSWDKLCIPKGLGGTDFKNIEIFKHTLLTKQAWRILSSLSSLLSQFLESKYFSDTSFMSVSLDSRPCFAWRSVLFGRELLETDLNHMIGNGRSLPVWSTPQLVGRDRMCIPLMKNILVDLNLSQPSRARQFSSMEPKFT